jgi:hypothetical protein
LVCGSTPDSTAHKLVGNNGQVLFNFHGHNLTLTGDKTIQYNFDSFDNRIPYGNNSHRHYYNRFVFILMFRKQNI